MTGSPKTTSVKKIAKLTSARLAVRIPGELNVYLQATMRTSAATATDVILQALRFHRDGFQRIERDRGLEALLAAQGSRIVGLESKLDAVAGDLAGIVSLLRMSLGFDDAELEEAPTSARIPAPAPISRIQPPQEYRK